MRISEENIKKEALKSGKSYNEIVANYLDTGRGNCLSDAVLKNAYNEVFGLRIDYIRKAYFILIERYKNRILKSKNAKNILKNLISIGEFDLLDQAVFNFIEKFINSIDCSKISTKEMLYVSEIYKILKINTYVKDFEIFYKSAMERTNDLNGLIDILFICYNQKLTPNKHFWEEIELRINSIQGEKMKKRNNMMYELLNSVIKRNLT